MRGICDITNSLGTNPGPMFSVHRCVVDTQWFKSISDTLLFQADYFCVLQHVWSGPLTCVLAGNQKLADLNRSLLLQTTGSL